MPVVSPEIQPVITGFAAALAILGVILWLLGACFSRSLITLAAVAIGTWLGLHVPRWFGISAGTWATAVGGALIFGVSGYIFHNTVVRFGLHSLWASGRWPARG
jgi:hypothetical protein